MHKKEVNDVTTSDKKIVWYTPNPLPVFWSDHMLGISIREVCSLDIKTRSRMS